MIGNYRVHIYSSRQTGYRSSKKFFRNNKGDFIFF
uniref:Uncharacterized protein n=1 Tax=Raoultella planticola TaxID=575 RepID=W8CUI8_RAOPL|nr:hypothetical protein pKpNDM1_00295 [Raoultella planticola]